MKVLVIDNYDSFTYNLVQYIERIKGTQVEVWRNDRFQLDEVEPFEKVLISPGPGIPDESGQTKPVIQRFGATKSILGVCLGHQAIAEVYGGSIRNMHQVFHGISSEMVKQEVEDPIFKGLPDRFDAGRYHSWIVEEELPDTLQVTARSTDGLIMALKHRDHKVHGVQFHPESVLTEYGGMIIKNWISEK